MATATVVRNGTAQLKIATFNRLTGHQLTIETTNQASDLQLFDALGVDLRTGVSNDGRAYVVTTDLAKALDVRDANHLAGHSDLGGHKGTEIVGTPGGPQRLNVLYKRGVFHVLMLSRKPKAMEFKDQLFDYLEDLERQSTNLAVPGSFADALELAAKQARELEAAREQVFELQPKADKYEALLDADGLVGMTAIADMLDVHVNRLTNWLTEEDIFRRQISEGQRGKDATRNLPRRSYQTSGHFEVRMERKGWHKYPVAYATSSGLDLILTRWAERDTH